MVRSAAISFALVIFFFFHAHVTEFARWRKIQVHLKLDFSTLWWILWLAFHRRHPWTAMYRVALQQQLRVMDTPPTTTVGVGTNRGRKQRRECCEEH